MSDANFLQSFKTWSVPPSPSKPAKPVNATLSKSANNLCSKILSSKKFWLNSKPSSKPTFRRLEKIKTSSKTCLEIFWLISTKLPYPRSKDKRATLTYAWVSWKRSWKRYNRSLQRQRQTTMRWLLLWLCSLRMWICKLKLSVRIWMTARKYSWPGNRPCLTSKVQKLSLPNSHASHVLMTSSKSWNCWKSHVLRIRQQTYLTGTRKWPGWAFLTFAGNWLTNLHLTCKEHHCFSTSLAFQGGTLTIWLLSNRRP